MPFKFSKQSGYLAVGCLIGFVAASAFTPILSVFAQNSRNPLTSHPDLSEVQAYIRSCRKVIPVNGSVEVYDNTDLSAKSSNRIGTVNVGTPLMLTGVMREENTDNPTTVVQVYLDDRRLSVHQPVGWVDASKITPC